MRRFHENSFVDLISCLLVLTGDFDLFPLKSKLFSWKETPFITDCNFQEMLENMRVGLSTNLKELHIWLWRFF
jgi:hypothetical protein